VKNSVIVETTEPFARGPYTGRGEVKIVIVIEAESIAAAEADLTICSAQARSLLLDLPNKGSRIPEETPVRRPSTAEATANVHASASSVRQGSLRVDLAEIDSVHDVRDATVGHIDLAEIPLLAEGGTILAKPKPRPIRDNPQA
jgi:hypothetical protein